MLFAAIIELVTDTAQVGIFRIRWYDIVLRKP